MSIVGRDRGAVYVLDGECQAYWSDEEFYRRFSTLGESSRAYLELRREGKLGKPVGYDNMYLLAENFDEFLSCCRPHIPKS